MRSLMLTLAAVTLAGDHATTCWCWRWPGSPPAWRLHSLLTFFDERPQALIAAHKKFIASRVADLCLLAAVVLVGHQLGTLEIDQAVAAAAAQPAMSASAAGGGAADRRQRAC